MTFGLSSPGIVVSNKHPSGLEDVSMGDRSICVDEGRMSFRYPDFGSRIGGISILTDSG